jgi:hypothetical protein
MFPDLPTDEIIDTFLDYEGLYPRSVQDSRAHPEDLIDQSEEFPAAPDTKLTPSNASMTDRLPIKRKEPVIDLTSQGSGDGFNNNRGDNHLPKKPRSRKCESNFTHIPGDYGAQAGNDSIGASQDEKKIAQGPLWAHEFTASSNISRVSGKRPMAASKSDLPPIKRSGTAKRAISRAELDYRMVSASEAEIALLKAIRSTDTKSSKIFEDRAANIRRLFGSEASPPQASENPAVLADRLDMAKERDVALLDKVIEATNSFLANLLRARDNILKDFEGEVFQKHQAKRDAREKINNILWRQQERSVDQDDEEEEEVKASSADVPPASPQRVKIEPQVDEEFNGSTGKGPTSDVLIPTEQGGDQAELPGAVASPAIRNNTSSLDDHDPRPGQQTAADHEEVTDWTDNSDDGMMEVYFPVFPGVFPYREGESD